MAQPWACIRSPVWHWGLCSQAGTFGSHHPGNSNVGLTFPPVLCPPPIRAWSSWNHAGCHLLTGQKTDTASVFRGYTDMKSRNKQGLGCSSVGHFISPSQMPFSCRRVLLALSVPVVSLWPSQLFLLMLGCAIPGQPTEIDGARPVQRHSLLPRAPLLS